MPGGYTVSTIVGEMLGACCCTSPPPVVCGPCTGGVMWDQEAVIAAWVAENVPPLAVADQPPFTQSIFFVDPAVYGEFTVNQTITRGGLDAGEPRPVSSEIFFYLQSHTFPYNCTSKRVGFAATINGVTGDYVWAAYNLDGIPFGGNITIPVLSTPGDSYRICVKFNSLTGRLRMEMEPVGGGTPEALEEYLTPEEMEGFLPGCVCGVWFGGLLHPDADGASGNHSNTSNSLLECGDTGFPE